MEPDRQYFPEFEEWSPQEREFASRAIQAIGQAGWNRLLRLQQTEGKEAFLRAVHAIWPDGRPPGDAH
jgi:hypothetical protein